MNLSFQANGFWGIAADVLLLAAGFALIIKGGDLFVDSSVRIARRLGVPEMIVGATIVSIGTTLPEIVTSVTSVVKGISAGGALGAGYDSLAVGNAVGSVMCNAGLILGLVLLIKPPAVGDGFAVKGAYLLFSLAALAFFAATGGGISVAEGVTLLALFVVFTGMNIYGASKAMAVRPAEEKAVAEVSGGREALCFTAGAAAIALGAVLLVDNAQSLCIGAGIPQQIVGITVVAVGTSFPELVASLTSLKKGAAAVGVGNVIGANVINATLLLGTVACISGKGLGIDDVTADVAVWVALAICAALVLPSAFTKKTYRWQGAAMLALYLGFIVYNAVIIVI